MARVLTKQQFATGTNIDGDRLDKAFGDIQNSINDVPLDHIKTRLMPYQISGGFTPTRSKHNNKEVEGEVESCIDPFAGATQVSGIDCWLPQTWTYTNTPYEELAFGIASIPDGKKENAITQKGALRNTDYHDINADFVRYYQMSNVFQTTSPLIIDEITIK